MKVQCEKDNGRVRPQAVERAAFPLSPFSGRFGRGRTYGLRDKEGDDMATALKLGDSYDWRAQLGTKLVSPEEAVSHIKSGDRVTMSISHATPFTLCVAVAARLMEIKDVVLNHSASLFNWELPGLGERYRFESIYLSPVGRDLFADGRADFVPVA
jgi:hypothetical protein